MTPRLHTVGDGEREQPSTTRARSPTCVSVAVEVECMFPDDMT